MAEPLPKPIKRHLNYVGWYQIAGGSFGVLVTAWSIIFGETELSELNIIFYALFFLLFSYSIFSGILCIGAKETALTHTFVNQALQAVNFSLFGYGLTYVSGFYFVLFFDLADQGPPGMNFGLSTIYIQFNGSTLYPHLGINLIAFFFLYWAWQLRKRIEREKQVNLL